MASTGNPDDTRPGPDPDTSEPATSEPSTSDPGHPRDQPWPVMVLPSLRLHLVADTVAPSLVRERLRTWLTAQGWPAGQREDIVLAVSEAVSNAVEHAYANLGTPGPPRTFELCAAAHPDPDADAGAGGLRWVSVAIRDYGRWRPAPADDENRRRGIPMMRACMDTVAIEALTDEAGRPAGTRVTLGSAPVPARQSPPGG